MRRLRTPASYVGRNASLVLRLRRAVVSGRRPEQQTRGQLWSGVQGRSPWGESPQAFDYTRKLVTCPGLRATAQHRTLLVAATPRCGFAPCAIARPSGSLLARPAPSPG